jgi:hypothetical protein
MPYEKSCKSAACGIVFPGSKGEVTATEVQTTINALVTANLLMRIGHGKYGVTDSYLEKQRVGTTKNPLTYNSQRVIATITLLLS